MTLLPFKMQAKCYGLGISALLRGPESAEIGASSGVCPFILNQGDTIDISIFEDGSDCIGHWCTIRRDGILIDSVAVNYAVYIPYQALIITTPGEYQIRAGLLAYDLSGSSTPYDHELRLSVITGIPPSDIVRLGIRGLFLEGAMPTITGAASMSSYLWSAAIVSSTEPYSSMGLTYGGSGGELLPTVQFLAFSPTIVDWVRLELYEGPELSNCVSAINALLSTNGVVRSSTWNTSLEFQTPPGEYFLRIVHRNHLPVTFGPMQFDQFGSCLVISSDEWPVIGEDTRVPSGSVTHALRAGNARPENALQRISYVGANNDRDAILQRVGGSNPLNIVSGYYNEDVNMDGMVKYTGTNNDRDVVLRAIGGIVPTAVVHE